MKKSDTEEWENYIKNVKPIETLLIEPKTDKPPSTTAIERVILSPQSHQSLDLHGLTLSEAHNAVMTFLETAKGSPLTVITGLSGQIQREFPIWMESVPNIRVEESKSGGSFKIYRKKIKNGKN